MPKEPSSQLLDDFNEAYFAPSPSAAMPRDVDEDEYNVNYSDDEHEDVDLSNDDEDEESFGGDIHSGYTVCCDADDVWSFAGAE